MSSFQSPEPTTSPADEPARLTPAVRALIAINIAVMLVQVTVLFKDPYPAFLAFDAEGLPGRWYTAFRADPDPVRTGLLDAYRPLCATLGRQVRVELPVGRFMTGVARDIDPDGRLLVSDNPGDQPMAISAGDVVHVR